MVKPKRLPPKNRALTYPELFKELEDIRKKFELFFLGQISHPPSYSDINRLKTQILVALSEPSLRSERFKIKSLSSKFHQLKDYWDRIMNEIESGTFRKEIAREKYRQMLYQFETHAKTHEGRIDHAIELLFQKYKNLVGNKVDKKSFITKARSLYMSVKAVNPERKVKICLVRTSTGFDLKAEVV